MPDTATVLSSQTVLDAPEPQSPFATLDELRRTHALMLAALNHEIRTPLTGILGMQDLLLESSLNTEQRDYVRSTRLCAESLLESLSNALEYAAVTGGNLQLSEAAFRLQELVRTAVASMQSRAEARGLFLQLLFEPSGDGAANEIVIGDAIRLRQVICILLSHAIKTCLQDEITVAVSTFASDEDQKLILTVSVGDNGPDILAEQVNRLFEPPEMGGYNQAGLELGLPLAFQLVRAMGGRLEAEAISGSGTLLTVTLPLRIQDNAGEQGPGDGLVGPAQRPHVLLVEDNEVAQRFMTTVLERKGYRVRVAPTGPEAIDAVATETFDLVLMDIQMPGMDGIETTRRIRHLPGGKFVPIVACTANTSSETRNSCADAGMNDFLAKPVHTGELVEIAGKYIATRGRV
jgi:CheY-like chemotaxis protein